MRVRTAKDVDDIKAAVEGVCREIGHRVPVVVNYDHFRIDPELVDAYAAMVRHMEASCYTEVARYTSSAFLRLKLGDALERAGVKPHLFETAEAGRRAGRPERGLTPHQACVSRRSRHVPAVPGDHDNACRAKRRHGGVRRGQGNATMASSTSTAAPLMPPFDGPTLVTALLAGIAADVTWEMWARLLPRSGSAARSSPRRWSSPCSGCRAVCRRDHPSRGRVRLLSAGLSVHRPAARAPGRRPGRPGGWWRWPTASACGSSRSTSWPT